MEGENPRELRVEPLDPDLRAEVLGEPVEMEGNLRPGSTPPSRPKGDVVVCDLALYSVISLPVELARGRVDPAGVPGGELASVAALALRAPNLEFFSDLDLIFRASKIGQKSNSS